MTLKVWPKDPEEKVNCSLWRSFRTLSTRSSRARCSGRGELSFHRSVVFSQILPMLRRRESSIINSDGIRWQSSKHTVCLGTVILVHCPRDELVPGECSVYEKRALFWAQNKTFPTSREKNFHFLGVSVWRSRSLGPCQDSQSRTDSFSSQAVGQHWSWNNCLGKRTQSPSDSTWIVGGNALEVRARRWPFGLWTGTPVLFSDAHFVLYFTSCNNYFAPTSETCLFNPSLFLSYCLSYSLILMICCEPSAADLYSRNIHYCTARGRVKEMLSGISLATECNSPIPEVIG